jgi:antitoxin component of MazEF toxin-antitoxin module
MKSLTRTRAVGGSLIITIPSEIVKEKSLKEGELVEIDVEKIKQSYFGRFKGIGSMTQEDKFKGQLEE